jgi:hypothetical protein
MKLRLAFAITLAACGGGGSSAGPVDEGTAEPVCADLCQHEIDCETEVRTLEECTADCVDDVVGIIREDAFEDIAGCMIELACGADEDPCVEECAPTDSHQTYEDRCREELPACGVEGAELDNTCEVTPMPGVDGDDRGFLCLIAVDHIEDLTDCLDEPDCEAIALCYQEVGDRFDL